MYLDLKDARVRIHKYFKQEEGDYSQLIKDYIIVKFTDDDTNEMTAKQFEEYLKGMSIRRILSIRMDRIKSNLTDMSHKQVKELNELLTKIDELWKTKEELLIGDW